VLGTGEFIIDSSVKIYPNPVKDVFTVDADTAIESLELYDVQGRLLQISTAGSNSASFDMSSRQRGIYFLKVYTDKSIKVERILKE